MSGELTLVIRGNDSDQKFNQQEFTKFCQKACGGRISTVSQSKIDWTLKWSGSEYELKDVIAKVENGKIDEWIKDHDGFYLLELTENEECLYSYIPESKPAERIPVRVESSKLQQLAPSVDVLLVTATPIERETVLAEMEPWPDEQTILQGAPTETTYRFGRFGRYRTAHVECTMGSGGAQGSTLTTQNAIKELKPKAVLILGIAFGIDRTKQHLGDVIVAESVYSYDFERVGDRNIPRANPISCGRILSERFRNNSPNWQLECGRRFVEVHQGPILSGGKLVDDKKFRDHLVNNVCQTAEGGEMEGAGAYAAAEGSKVEIILVKGICDWADGHKNELAQPFAAYASVSLAKHVLNQPSVLAPLGAVDLESPAAKELLSPLKPLEPSPLVKVSQLMFQQTRAKTSLANKYKSLHDEFQKLELWKGTINRLYVRSTLPESDLACLELPGDSLVLHNHVERIVEELDGEEVKKEIGTRRIGWQEKLRQAEREFNQAIEQKDQRKLKESVERIQSVLRPGLSLINDSLVNTVKELQLHQSVETLKTLRAESIFERLSPDQLSLFDKSLKDLDNIQEILEDRLAIHNNFQGIDNELDNIDFVNVTQVFLLQWKILERMLQELCGERESEWANKLRQQRKELESAVTEKDASKIKQSFFTLRSNITVYFNDIDIKLKQDCENLKDYGGVLDTLLKMIPNIA